MCTIFHITAAMSEESESDSEGDTEHEPSTGTEDETPEVKYISIYDKCYYHEEVVSNTNVFFFFFFF